MKRRGRCQPFACPRFNARFYNPYTDDWDALDTAKACWKSTGHPIVQTWKCAKCAKIYPVECLCAYECIVRPTIKACSRHKGLELAVVSCPDCVLYLGDIEVVDNKAGERVPNCKLGEFGQPDHWHCSEC